MPLKLADPQSDAEKQRLKDFQPDQGPIEGSTVIKVDAPEPVQPAEPHRDDVKLAEPPSERKSAPPREQRKQPSMAEQVEKANKARDDALVRERDAQARQRQAEQAAADAAAQLDR